MIVPPLAGQERQVSVLPATEPFQIPDAAATTHTGDTGVASRQVTYESSQVDDSAEVTVDLLAVSPQIESQ